MEQLTKRRLLLAVGLTVSLVASVWFAVQVRSNWPEVVKTFRGARHLHLHLIPSIGFIALVYAFRVARWRRFLAPIKRVRASSVAAATCIGFTANNLLPLRAGELIRPYVLHRKEGVRFGHCLATAVGLERVFDLIGLMLLILATSLMMPGGLLAASADAQVAEDLGRIRLGIILFGAAAAAGAVGFTALALFPRPFVALGERCTRVLPARWRGPANAFFHSLADAMGFLKDWREVVLAVGYSFGLWLSIGLSTFWLVKGLGLDLGLAGSLFVVVAVGVAVAVPQAPGYVGVFHWAASLGARTFGADPGAADAMAIVMWLVNIIPITLVGLVFLWREGLNLKTLASAASEMKDAAGSHADAGGGGV